MRPDPGDRGLPRPMPASGAFEGLPLANAAHLEDARLGTLTATTMRAALDLLIGDHAAMRPIHVAWDDGALEARVAVGQPEALEIAGGLMETVGGSLGPATDGRPEWVLRVPVAGPRAMYLMLEQGTLALALPWHAVLRVRMAPRASIEMLARREGARVLAPLVSVPQEADERPAVLLGLGLRRAYFVADRLVWRMPAEPAATEPGATGLPIGAPVRTAEGAVFWALDPIELLHDVEPMPLPSPAPRTRPVTREPAAPEPKMQEPVAVEPDASGAVTREPAADAAPAQAPDRTEDPTPAIPPAAAALGMKLVELRAEDVEPLGDEPPAPRPEAPRTSPLKVAPPLRRALVAEDSIIGRIFLERLLVQRGFEVETVPSAGALDEALERGPWSLVLADVELPDSPQGRHLARLIAKPRTPGVALVRDHADRARAGAAGLAHSLPKPFEAQDLDRLLFVLGLGKAT